MWILCFYCGLIFLFPFRLFVRKNIIRRSIYHSTLHSCPFLGPSKAPGIHRAQLAQLGLSTASGRWQISLHVSQNPQLPSFRHKEQLLPRDRQDEVAAVGGITRADVFCFSFDKKFDSPLSPSTLWITTMTRDRKAKYALWKYCPNFLAITDHLINKININ